MQIIFSYFVIVDSYRRGVCVCLCCMCMCVCVFMHIASEVEIISSNNSDYDDIV